MRLRRKSTGYRQAAWDKLRSRDEWPDAATIAREIGASPNGLRTYIAGLKKYGYVRDFAGGGIGLVRNTGPRAPSYSVHTGELRDWNIDPAMSGAELGALIKASGLSLTDWLRSHGLRPEGATRLRQMINGQRPVSEEMAALARTGPN